MQPHGEGRRNAEIAATAVQRPKEFGVLGLARAHHLARGGDELDLGEPDAGEPELARHPAVVAAKDVATDACRRHSAAGSARQDHRALEAFAQPVGCPLDRLGHDAPLTPSCMAGWSDHVLAAPPAR